MAPSRCACAVSFSVVAALATAGCSFASSPSVEVGDCLEMTALAGAEVTDVPTVDCAEKHDGQVVHTFEMPGGDYPSAKQWRRAIEQDCLEGFEDFVGRSYAESELLAQDLSPTRASWQDGDRQVLCVAFLSEGTTTTSFEGAEI